MMNLCNLPAIYNSKKMLTEVIQKAYKIYLYDWYVVFKINIWENKMNLKGRA